VTVFDGKVDSFDHWEIQWNAFAEVEGIIDVLYMALDYNIPKNNKHVLDPVIDTYTVMIASSKATKLALAYFALAYKTMTILRMTTKSK
jgi:hypothetical protein